MFSWKVNLKGDNIQRALRMWSGRECSTSWRLVYKRAWRSKCLSLFLLPCEGTEEVPVRNSLTPAPRKDFWSPLHQGEQCSEEEERTPLICLFQFLGQPTQTQKRLINFCTPKWGANLAYLKNFSKQVLTFCLFFC